MTNLFAYGTLMCEDIIKSVAGFLPGKQEGTLQGYRRLEIEGEQYPGLIVSEGFKVEGIIYYDIPEEGWQRLDRFEGEMYQRIKVCALLKDGSSVEVHTYVVKNEHVGRLRAKDWSFEQFLSKGKGAFVQYYSGYDEIF